MAGVQDLMTFLDASPSPWHAAASAAALLGAAGFVEVDETERWDEVPPAGYVRRGAALVAWRLPSGSASALRIVGAHTDSPGLRIHARPDQALANWRSLGVEIYGGVLLNSWLDRDLGIAGRVVAPDGTSTLVNVSDPVARVPQLAIHLDRDVNDRGLVLDKHQHLRPVWASSEGTSFAAWLAEQTGADLDARDPAFWDLCLYDTQPAAVLGVDRSLLASGRLDNQVSCWAGVTALTAVLPTDHIAVVALFDHEEVGSASRSGAAGPVLDSVLTRVLASVGVADADGTQRVFAASSCVSADNAHAIHPNYPERHDAGHAPLVNHGPAIKINANQRYATDAGTAALFQRACADAGVPVQTFVSRNNVPCGSTIGPITATRLGIATVDVGVPQLSMHSARELCGADDPGHLAKALEAYLG
jgi:aspartyl aminopeptidase